MDAAAIAVGGAILSAMLLACAKLGGNGWTRDALGELINVQRAALAYRKQNLDLADDIGTEAARLLELAREQKLVSEWASASTVHTSAVDEEGIACAITASSGYGSGEMPSGTGLWKCLDECSNCALDRYLRTLRPQS